MRDTSDLRVFISTQDSTCDECGENLGHGDKAWNGIISPQTLKSYGCREGRDSLEWNLKMVGCVL